MSLPDFHFKIPPKKIEKVAKITWNELSLNKILDHILEINKFNSYELSLYDNNKDNKVDIDDFMFAIKEVNNIKVISVYPSKDLNVGVTKGTLLDAKTPYGAIGEGSGGSGGL